MTLGPRVRTTHMAPMPSERVSNSVLDTPGCAAVEVRREPAALARRCNSWAKSTLASLDWP